MDLAPEIVAELIAYDAASGALTWRERSIKWFADSGKHKAWHFRNMWNRRYAGKPALSGVTNQGYLAGSLLNRHVKAHRAAWLLGTGAWPDGDIDHIDRDKSNNRLINLRCVSRGENNQNHPLHRNNKTGFSQVYRRGGSRWIAVAPVNGRRAEVGRFDTFEEAVAARKRATARAGYHPNHGLLDRETARAIGIGGGADFLHHGEPFA